ncbi:hypothetical protein [Listeria cornellensis]|uniref:Uncharacterized protein n=1 Tax=Listeria cornellensis FSL F6-0969 TaxID=1265820 RepID=W7BH24_9LIST|nr:hypothetical protein [Listeria cornellensis]EUJ25232.1 hypothetical protein PCORN_18309 [Listeria cornellensis FSL F6-0969]
MMASSVHVWSDTRIYFKEARTLAEQGLEVDFYAIDYPSEKVDVQNLTMHYMKPQKKTSPLCTLALPLQRNDPV